jgi:hypothetical protein
MRRTRNTGMGESDQVLGTDHVGAPACAGCLVMLLDEMCACMRTSSGAGMLALHFAALA